MNYADHSREQARRRGLDLPPLEPFEQSRAMADFIEGGRMRTDRTRRPTIGETFLAVAQILAERSTCPEGARHGAVITVHDRVVATGYGSPAAGAPPCRECWLRKRFAETGVKDWSVCPSVHAEANAVASAARIGAPIMGGVIWVTREPCAACARLLLNAGVVMARWPGGYAPIAAL